MSHKKKCNIHIILISLTSELICPQIKKFEVHFIPYIKTEIIS